MCPSFKECYTGNITCWNDTSCQSTSNKLSKAMLEKNEREILAAAVRHPPLRAVASQLLFTLGNPFKQSRTQFRFCTWLFWQNWLRNKRLVALYDWSSAALTTSNERLNIEKKRLIPSERLNTRWEPFGIDVPILTGRSQVWFSGMMSGGAGFERGKISLKCSIWSL